MIVYLIVLIAILVICCGIMLYLYFSVRKEADNYAHEYRRYSELYAAAKSDKEFYRDELDKRLEENIELEKVSKHATELLGRKDSEIKLLRNQVNDCTVNYTKTTVAANDVNGNILIPIAIFKNEDPAESSLFYASVWDTLVNVIAKDILRDSTTFYMEYDISHDVYRLGYHYKKFLSKDYKSNGYRIEPWSESPVEDLINLIRKKEDKSEQKCTNTKEEIYCTECPHFEHVAYSVNDWFGASCKKDGHKASPSMYAIQTLHDNCPLKKQEENTDGNKDN